MGFGLVIEARIIICAFGYQELLHDIPMWGIHEGVTAVARHVVPAGGIALVLKPVFEGRGITVGVSFHRRPHASVPVPVGVFPVGFVNEKGGDVFAAAL